MPAISVLRPHICTRTVRANLRDSSLRSEPIARRSLRSYGNASATKVDDGSTENGSPGAESLPGNDSAQDAVKEDGAFTRRMREMSEEALESGGHGAIKAVEEAGFSADLKAQLEQRIAAANFASSEANLPTSTSRFDRDLATADIWTGTESIHDASLRMLNDSHKPLRLGRAPKMPGVEPPRSIDTGHKRTKEVRGLRLANARDRSVVYSSIKDDMEIEALDREKRLQELKDRFDPHARAVVPGSIQGLASLANKRIEDAIARGQFKNIPRGKGKNVERDYNANSPFIDTTEYFMNKIIQRQEIVPPWIEKQQELASAASKFRSRMRADWKRHAARMISSKGGTLQDQIRRAEAYAKAELIANPRFNQRKGESEIVEKDHASQISLSGELKSASSGESPSPTVPTADAVTHPRASHAPSESIPASTADQVESQPRNRLTDAILEVPPATFPFRDPEWERIESGYHTIAIKDLNDKARSYNLQAPELAKRPYFNLQRELNACYAEVAPQLPQAIVDRARRPPQRAGTFGTSQGKPSVLDNMMGGPVRVRDERREKQYGFKQFWKDLWADKSAAPY